MPVTVGSHTIATNDGTIVVVGALLAYVSGKADNHAFYHDNPGQVCNACKWSEIRIFSLDRLDTKYIPGSANTWLIQSQSMADKERFPDFRTKVRCNITDAKYMVWEILSRGESKLSRVASNVLATAASFDPSLADVYIEKT